MKKQSISIFYYDFYDECLDKLLLEAVLWLVFLVNRFELIDDSINDVSSRKLLSDIVSIIEFYFFLNSIFYDIFDS